MGTKKNGASAADPPAYNDQDNYFCHFCGSFKLRRIAPERWRCLDCERSTGGNGFPFEWMIRQDPKTGDFGKLETSSRFGFKLESLRIDHPNATDLPALAVRELGLPDWFLARIREWLQEQPKRLDLRRADGRLVRVRDGDVYLVTHKRDDPEVEHVIGKPFHVRRRVLVEEDFLAVVEDGSGEHAGTHSDIMHRLRENNQVLVGRAANDIVSFLVHNCATRTVGARTYNVQSNDGRLELPTEIHPRNQWQTKAHDRLRKYLDIHPTPAQWQGYADFFSGITRREGLPALSLGALAPFANVLRANRIVVPGLLHYSRTKHTGKTSLAEAISCHLWAQEKVGRNAIESPYRFAAYADSIGAPILFDEAAGLDWNEWSDTIKEAFESPTITSRGTKDLRRHELYRSRAAFFFTTNLMPRLPPPLLERLIVVHFTERMRSSETYDQLLRNLDVLGPALAREGIKICDGRAARLVDIVEELGAQIGPRLPATTRRAARMWGAAYFALQVVERASGDALRAPPIGEFVDEVVVPAEETNASLRIDPLAGFRDWLHQWIAMQPHDQVTGTARAKDLLYREDIWESEPAYGIPGFWVSSPVLTIFNAAFKQYPESQISGLKALAQLVDAVYKIPAAANLGPEGFGTQKFLNGRNRRCVFVPDVDPAQYRQEKL